MVDEFTWEKFGGYENAERGSCVLFVHTKGPPFHWVVEDGLAHLPPGTEEARRSPRLENYYGHLEKLISLPIADCPGVNVYESEREQTGIIRR